VSSDYTVISADVTALTTRVVHARTISRPRSLFQDPDLVERGDDEIVVPVWWAERNHLASADG
jgi:hypothetical protein